LQHDKMDEPAKVPLAFTAMGRSFIARLARARVPSPSHYCYVARKRRGKKILRI
jgi:hypothetical protein